MPEYLCPSCEGGFPASLGTDDACPWCGECMDGAQRDVTTHPVGRTTTVADKIDDERADILTRLDEHESIQPPEPQLGLGAQAAPPEHERFGDALNERVGGPE